MNTLLERIANVIWPRRALNRALAHATIVTPYQRRFAYRHHPGRPGVEPTRFGDWEYNGRCTDFG